MSELSIGTQWCKFMNESLIFFNIDTCMEHRNLLLSMAWNGLRHLPWAVFSKVTLKLVFWLVCWWYIPIQPGSRSMCNSELSNTEKSTRSVVMMPMGSLEQYLCVAHSQRLFQFLPALLNLKEKEKLYSSADSIVQWQDDSFMNYPCG